MEKLNTIELNNVLKDVRNSYRVLALYQQRIYDTVKYIGNQYNLEFHSGWAKFGRGTTNGKSATENKRGVDWLGFYLYEFNLGDFVSDGNVYSFKIVHQADTGFFDANVTENINKSNVENYTDVEDSHTRLFFVISENANGCPIRNILNKHLSSETTDSFRNDKWLAAPYDIKRFLNQENTDGVIKNFNELCKKEFGLDVFNVK